MFLLPPSSSPLTRRRYGNPCPRPLLRCRSRALAVSGLALSPLPGQSTPLRSRPPAPGFLRSLWRSEEHTSELQSLAYLVCRLLLEKKKQHQTERLCRVSAVFATAQSVHNTE